VSTPIETIRDREGSVALGSVGDDVLFAEFTEKISAAMGSAFARRLGEHLERSQKVRYFADLSTLKDYDLLARSAIFRMILANRLRFESMTVLSVSEGITTATKLFTSELNVPLKLLTDAGEFQRVLYEAAPLARAKLDRSTWVRLVPSSTP
jgi:hypothetical protein